MDKTFAKENITHHLNTYFALTSRVIIIAALYIAAAGFCLWSQDAPSASGNDSIFDEESVKDASNSGGNPQDEFLKYDTPRIGGQFTGTATWSSYWDPGWTAYQSWPEQSITPQADARITITAKPETDFGVNLEFRVAYPYSTTITGYSDTLSKGVDYKVASLNVWAAYAKYSFADALFFSFGKQPLGWGASRGFFQPADDIFAMTTVDVTDLTAAREGPISFQTSYTVPNTLNTFSFYSGIPIKDNLKPEDIRVAAKAGFRFGDTGIALGGYYCWNDYPRALLMGTSGLGNFNFYLEGILKYGSERYFIDASTIPLVANQVENKFYYSGTIGTFYNNSDNKLVLNMQYYYNGEGQANVNARQAFRYYFGLPEPRSARSDIPSSNLTQIDRMRFGTHYAFISFNKDELIFKNLSFFVYSVWSISDGSGFVSPSLTWKFFDYMKLQAGPVFNWGSPDTEFIVYSPVSSGISNTNKPGIGLNIMFTLGTGMF